MRELLTTTLLILLADIGIAANIMPPADQRFADSDGGEVPDFQRHVVPLLGRLGCNGRACHGSFQGRGGLRLSLFGYDFDMDHAALTKQVGDADQPRVDLQSPGQSLILNKPTLQLDHEGGKRFAPGRWQHRLLRRWIATGARAAAERHRLARLEVAPAEIVFRGPLQDTSLRVVAVWQDGTREDVTCLCRFRSNDESVATVDADGRVAAAGTGDTHVVAFYDNGVLPIPVFNPIGDRRDAHHPEPASRTEVDALVLAKLRQLGVEPSPRCSDAEFLRRASIDITGTLPTPDEVTAFLSDTTAGKRGRKIDELLERPASAAWWANKLCDYTGNSPYRQSELGQELAVKWYSWIYRRLRDNVPYDEIVAGIVQANGRREGQSYDDYAAEMSAYFREQDPADFAERQSMPFYWARRNLEQPEDKAIGFAHSFLGVRLACAQCHKHPYDQWTQQDFQGFSAVFAGLSYGVAPESSAAHQRLALDVGQRQRGNQGAAINKDLLALAEDGKTVPWREVYYDSSGTKSNNEPRLLGANATATVPQDPRSQLMRWLREKEHPYFARAFVNRVWANYFHRGIVEPPDDLNLANPPANRELLDYLAAGFVENDYDIKWLHREITRSDAYQRSWKPTTTNRDDMRNFSRCVPRRLPAEVVYDALKQATAARAELVEVRENLDRRASGHLSTLMAGTYAMHVFGKPERVLQCDCERSDTPTLLQSIFLQNDPLVQVRLDESGWLREVSEQPSGALDSTVAQLVREAYLRTVSRLPTDEEVRRGEQYVAASGSLREGLQDLLWALLNSKEFILNH